MTLYESVFIARQDISSSQVDALADSFQKIIEDGGGQVAKRENWGLRSLAYKIKKNRKGHYVLFNIDSPSDAVREYERQMKLNEDILRYMTLRVDELDPEPSVVMQGRGRSDRGDRGDRGRRFEESPKVGDKPAGAKPDGTETAKAATPEAPEAPEAKAADGPAPKTAAKPAESGTEKAAPAVKADVEAAKSEKPADDDKAAPAKKTAPAKDDEGDKKSAAVKKTAATTKKGEEA